MLCMLWLTSVHRSSYKLRLQKLSCAMLCWYSGSLPAMLYDLKPSATLWQCVAQRCSAVLLSVLLVNGVTMQPRNTLATILLLMVTYGHFAGRLRGYRLGRYFIVVRRLPA
jgi:hypothetical protein